MKIINQFLELSGAIYWAPIVSTVMLFMAFGFIVYYAFCLSRRHVNEMRNLPLDNEN